MAYCKWLVAVSIIAIVNETSAQEAHIIAAPVARVAVLNSDAIFSCDGTGFTLLWCIDGLQDNNIAIVDRGIDVDTISDPVARTWNSTLTVPATQENNKTVIQCEVVGSNGHKESPNVTLLIQGILAPPSNLAIAHVNDYNQRLTWTPPFTLDITDVDPDITYSVCCNVTTNCTRTTNPYYDFPTLCDPVEFTVTALNPVGESEPSSIAFGPIYTQTTYDVQYQSVTNHDGVINVTCIFAKGSQAQATIGTPSVSRITTTFVIMTPAPTAIGTPVSITTTMGLPFILGVTIGVLLVAIASSVITCAPVILYWRHRRDNKAVDSQQQKVTFPMRQNLSYEDSQALRVTRGPQPTDIEECPAYGMLNRQQ